MRVTRTDKSPTSITLKIEAEKTDLAPIYSHALNHFKRSIKVPGFREGKAPANLVEKHVNQQALMDEFMEHALNDLYRRAIESQKLRPAAPPDVQMKKFVPYTQLDFEVELEVIGPVKLADYKTIKLAKPKVQISAKDVDEVLKSLQSRAADRSKAAGPAKKGDEVIIDFTGSDSDGKPVGGTDAKDYPLVLGSNSFIPGFEDNLIGAKAGENKKFDVIFPKDYAVAGLRDKRVTFRVDIKEISELRESKIDDEFAKKAGPFNDLKELKADIKKQVAAERQRQADTEYQNELIRKITDKSEVDIPKSLIDEEIKRLEDDEKRNLAYRGQTWQEHLADEKVTEDEHRERYRPEAQGRVKAGLVLSEIAEEENIDVSPDELEVRMQLLKSQYQDPQMLAELAKPEAVRDINARLLTEKTINKLVDYAAKR